MSATVVLVATKGPLKGRVYRFDEHDTFIFGRAADCHARLPEDDRTASRHHFLLEVNPPHVRLRDLGSLNGTYVNELKCGGRETGETPQEAAAARVSQCDLSGGDVIRVGESQFLVDVQVPLACFSCGTVLPPREQPGASEHDITCVSCGTVQVVSHARRCVHCGRICDEESPNENPDTFLCESCRRECAEDPLRVLSEIAPQDLFPRVESVSRERDDPGSDLALPAAEGFRNSVIDGYEVLRRLGGSAHGAVYEARRTSDGRPVAIKVVLCRSTVSAPARAHFLRELDPLRALQHPRCVELFDVGAIGSTGFYFVSDFFPSGSLAILEANHGGRVPLEIAHPLLLAAAEGLAFIHERQIVHGDVKASNIMLTGDGSVRIADCGLVRSFDRAGFSGMVATGENIVAWPFVAREQITDYSHYLPATDVWCLAACFYAILSGHPPRHIEPKRDPIETILREPAIALRKAWPDAPRGLAEVLDRALSDSLRHRFPTATEFRTALLEAETGVQPRG